MHHVTGIFSDPNAAEAAVRKLVEEHFNPDEVSILVTDRAGTHQEPVAYETGVTRGGTVGAALGGVLGALGATLVATGVVTGTGLTIFAVGPLLAALRGGVIGVAVGQAVGALGGLGFWKDEAHIHAEALEKGGIVVAVPAEHEHADHARKVFAAAGADQVRG